ncbi:FadR/GntR family transcriptional regulator [Agrococcus jejuensis]|uniref:DNA-binding transcriptional regulator, FadR family n=1 Tax=Agrococcus jejuensis TaxID=399736 RepID=A0A1G8CJF9_9MICO|nr:FCD domain-containing protein [Agrococcus jejuensis]SDH45598.1 DNA-binding transcriptional regulator, FadR family [Agrococcus jejuensis]
MDDALDALVARLVDLSAIERDGTRRLPPERELVEQLDMSRGTLRERLSQLESLGILDRRQGHGTYLRSPGASVVRTTFTLMGALGGLRPDQVDQAREMLEIVTTVEAAKLATAADVAELGRLTDAMIAATAAAEHEAGLEADLAFHRHLVTIVDNPILDVLQDGLAGMLRDTLAARRAKALRTETPAADGTYLTDTVHRQIVAALAANDADAARIAIRFHFDHHDAVVGSTDDDAGRDTTA